MMNLGIDMFRGSIEMAMMRDAGKAELKKSEAPWEELTLKNEEEEQQLDEYIRKIVRVMQNRMGEKMLSAVFLIPLKFDYTKRKKVRELALNAGIAYVRVGYASEMAGLAYAAEQNQTINETDLICNIREHHIEFSIFEHSRGYAQSKACMDCPSEIGWSSETAENVGRRMTSDLKQLLIDAGLSGWRGIHRILVVGEENTVVDYFLQKITGIVPLRRKYAGLKGAAYYAAQMSGMPVRVSLLKGAAPYDMAFALGEEGEFKTCLKRNSTIPIRKMEDILISSEKILYVYEGNYHNRKYDHIIARFPVDFAEEGDVVICYMDYSSLGEITVSVKNDKNQILMEETEL